jgi:uncharacterized membrane protein
MATLANTAASSIVIWAIVLIAAVLVGALGVFALRRSMFSDHSPHTDHAGLMEQMRRMVDRGEMTQDEYDQARRTIVEKAKAAREKAGPS